MRLEKVAHLIARFIINKHDYEIVKRSYFNETLNTLLKKDNFFFIQVGAHDGVRFDSLYEKITHFNISGIVIEPIPKYFHRLKVNYEEYPNVLPLNIALHPTEKEVCIYHVDTSLIRDLPKWSAGIGSIYQKHHNKTNIPDSCIVKEITPCKDLMSIIYEQKISAIDLIQIDTEGFDFEVLKMIDFMEIKPKIIKYEYVNLSSKDKDRSLSLLIKNGYKTYIENQDAIGILNEN